MMQVTMVINNNLGGIGTTAPAQMLQDIIAKITILYLFSQETSIPTQ